MIQDPEKTNINQENKICDDLEEIKNNEENNIHKFKTKYDTKNIHQLHKNINAKNTSFGNYIDTNQRTDDIKDQIWFFVQNSNLSCENQRPSSRWHSHVYVKLHKQGKFSVFFHYKKIVYDILYIVYIVYVYTNIFFFCFHSVVPNWLSNVFYGYKKGPKVHWMSI